MFKTIALFPEIEPQKYDGNRRYLPILTVSENHKGVLDVDTVKGCTMGLKAYPDGGCYGECYAMKTAQRYGIDFSMSISRKVFLWNKVAIFHAVKNHYAKWYRIGTAGDPCHDWNNTIGICEFLRNTGKIPVIITKHWMPLNDEQIFQFKKLNAVINTSTSGMDTDAEVKYRVSQIERLKIAGIRSINRVVTCDYTESTNWSRKAKSKQDYLLSITPMIDNPLRANKSSKRVVSGEINLIRMDSSIGGGKMVSLHDKAVYLGSCEKCPDQCGVIPQIIGDK